MGMWFTVREVPPLLAPYVSSLCGYSISGLAPGVHVGMPSTTLTCIVPIGGPIVVAGPAHSSPARALGAFVGGLHTAPAAIHHDGSQHGLQLALTPLGARALFGVPAGELSMQLVGLDDLLGAGGAYLAEQAHELRSWERRFDAVELALLRALDSVPSRHGASAVRPEVAWAWALLVGPRLPPAGLPPSDLPPSVREVAREIGWTERHLLREFRAEFGISPKQAARLHRFERSVAAVKQGATPLGEVAAACGYFDQSHLVRDWRDLAGTAPRAWLQADAMAG